MSKTAKALLETPLMKRIADKLEDQRIADEQRRTNAIRQQLATTFFLTEDEANAASIERISNTSIWIVTLDLADDVKLVLQSVGSFGEGHYSILDGRTVIAQTIKNAADLQKAIQMWAKGKAAIAELGAAKKKIVCPECGSDEVCRDATAVWSIESQEWELGSVQDQGYCNKCGKERNLTEVEVPS